MNINEISSALESFDDICNYNKDFAQLRVKFFLSKHKFFNIFRFRKYIENSHSGYYYKKALFFYTKSYINNSMDLINIFIRLTKKCLCKNSI